MFPIMTMARSILLTLCFFPFVTMGCFTRAQEAGKISYDNWGDMETYSGKGCVVLAAPHGTSDKYTGEMVRFLVHQKGYPAVIATGYIERDGTGLSQRINVNRPTEGRGLKWYNEQYTHRGRIVFGEYYRRVKFLLARNSPGLYVEVHGQSGIPKTIEVATKGITHSDAKRFKQIWKEELIRPGTDSRLLKDIKLNVEPIDYVKYSASASKRFGMISEVQTALHIELPRVIRFRIRQRSASVEILARTLEQFFRKSSRGCRET